MLIPTPRADIKLGQLVWVDLIADPTAVKMGEIARAGGKLSTTAKK